MAQQTAIQQMIDFINNINDNDSSEFNYYYDPIIGKLNELLEVEKQQISGAPELRYKDGRPMRKYNSTKLKAIEMENKQLTAVEWLTEKFTECGFTFSGNIFEQAKQMEKEQLENARPQIVSNCVIKEISDEEIEESNPFRIDGGAYNSSAAYQWSKGAKWYREQLKKKQI